MPSILFDLGWTNTEAQLYSIPPYVAASGCHCRRLRERQDHATGNLVGRLLLSRRHRLRHLARGEGQRPLHGRLLRYRRGVPRRTGIPELGFEQ